MGGGGGGGGERERDGAGGWRYVETQSHLSLVVNRYWLICVWGR